MHRCLYLESEDAGREKHEREEGAEAERERQGS